MIELTPLEETVAGKELIQLGIEQGIEKGIEQGIEKGIDKGELIGKILLAQIVVKRNTYSKKKLGQKNLRELRDIFRQLERELKTVIG